MNCLEISRSIFSNSSFISDRKLQFEVAEGLGLNIALIQVQIETMGLCSAILLKEDVDFTLSFNL
jgi:hypothetical protein